jgi:hypothetical protein
VSRVDALIVAAGPAEREAVLDAANGAPEWRSQETHLTGRLAAENGGTLTVALASAGAGARTAAPLISGLSPICVAMCGVMTADAVPGDVVVAQRTAMPALRPDDLPSYRRPGTKDAELWFMERLHHGEDPRRHPAFARYFPGGSWPSRLAGLVTDGLVVERAGSWALTDTGRLHIAHIVANDVYGPVTLPFEVHHGPAATGLELEAVADELGVPHWVVANGVVDQTGDDRFAVRAAAEVLFALLARLPPGRTVISDNRRVSAPGPPPLRGKPAR